MFYTRKGDDGSSGLFDSKERFPKTSLIYDALGSLDECNSLVGICVAQNEKCDSKIPVATMLRCVQEKLFIAQAELAGAKKQLTDADVQELEDDIAKVSEHIRDPHAFVIPGANEHSAHLDLARAVARRAERAVLRAKAECAFSEGTATYLNRLSSLLYVLARFAADEAGEREDNPSY